MATGLESILGRFRSLTSGDDFRLSFLYHLRYTCGKDSATATLEDKYTSVGLAVRDRVMEHMIATQQAYLDQDVKRVYYFSMEYLVGRLLTKNLVSLGILDLVREALTQLDCDLDEVAAVERDAALGNGGLGRLAACYMDSLATLGYPAYGYGIYYQYGLFRQEIRNGTQHERPDDWLDFGNPWALARPEHTAIVPVYGRIEPAQDRTGEYNPMWLDWRVVLGEPCDIPTVGYGGRTVNLLRLFKARASHEFDMEIFNSGDFVEAVRQKVQSETISRVLYPVDAIESGRELRLVQEYFLVACGIRDIVRRYRKTHGDWAAFPDKVAIQMNDTHPALAVAELQRFFVDEAGLSWDTSWDLVTRTLAYTNHTLMSEALESWPVALLEKIVPRHCEIIHEIDRRFLQTVRESCADADSVIPRVSLLTNGAAPSVRMAHLAVVGSHSVNGVAALHSRLLRERLFPDFSRLWPDKFRNVTNGITPRRWLLCANPGLSELLNRRLGQGWVTDLEQLSGLGKWVDDADLHRDLRQIKRANKRRLSRLVLAETGVAVDEDMLFDVQAKRLHEYKRQLLNALRIVDQYLQIKLDGRRDMPPRACLFAAKAAPGYRQAKLIIKFICSVADVVNSDPDTAGLLRVAFIPDYRVSLAEVLIPGADLSEQISLAGTEASGTGNMKFALNGALTIGTLDGANIEIRDCVGAENIFTFGLTVRDVSERRHHGYDPRSELQTKPRLRRVLDVVRDGMFSAGQRGLFQPLLHAILDEGDEFMVVADFDSYVAAQEQVDSVYVDQPEWVRRVVRNISGMGHFSSDRSVREYARDIWGIEQVEVPSSPWRA